MRAHRFDRNDPSRAALKNAILYYADYALKGAITLAGESCGAMLVDEARSGDFRTAGTTRLYIDVNHNQRFDTRGEVYAAEKPLNIKGTTHALTNLTATGTFAIARSGRKVAEILPPPDLGAGKPAIPFQAKTADGTAANFPGDFKGKTVMLDFWATWCGPCRGDIPHIAAAYEKLHSRGFEILGIRLDQENSADKLAAFTKGNEMPWPQVYDGKAWRAAAAEHYVIPSVPDAYLVDRDTDRVIAHGGELRGEGIATGIDKALNAKGP